MRGWGVRKYNIISFGRQMGICAKNYKNLPSRFFMGINGLKEYRKENKENAPNLFDFF